MSDLLIRNLDPEMSRKLEQRARAHDRDTSEEARQLLRTSLGLEGRNEADLAAPPAGVGLGTWMFSLVPPEYRVDLDCEMADTGGDPPDFS